MKNSIVIDACNVALHLKRRFTIKSNDYHAFDDAELLFKQMGIKTKFKELEKDGIYYIAEFEIIGVYQ